MYTSGAPAPPPPGAVDPGTIGQAAPYIIPKKVPKPGQTSKATPISMLQELCQKLSKTPRYDLLTMEGRAHQPSFVFRCVVGDLTGEGHGTSKKSAKHQAAENVLTQLKSGVVPGEEKLPIKGDELEKDQSMIHAGEINPIGTLQEMVVTRGWRLPDYSLASEAGPSHKKEFIICCSVEKLKEYGSGSSKKVAKRNAAGAMLSRMREIPSDSKEHVLDTDDIDPLNFSSGRRGLVPLELLRNSNGERITIAKVNESALDPIMQLHEYSAQHQFSVAFLDIKERSTMGLVQCFARLTTLPVSVLNGEGPTLQDAHNHAARNALQYLKIMGAEKPLTG